MLILLLMLTVHLQNTNIKTRAMEQNLTPVVQPNENNRIFQVNVVNATQSTLNVEEKVKEALTVAIIKDSGIRQQSEQITEYKKSSEKSYHVTSENMQLLQLFDPEWDITRDRRNRTIPAITMDLYESMKRISQNVDLIRCVRATKYLCSSSGIVVKFDFNGTQSEEQMLGSELYIYRTLRMSRRNYTDSSIIRLYQIILRGGRDEERSMQNADLHELLGVIYLTSYDQGWQIFNVNKTLEKWQNGEPNLGFLITVTDTWGNTIDPKYFGLATTQPSNLPCLVIRLRQSSSHDDLDKEDIDSNAKGSCRRISFYINFEKEELNSFMIHPKGVMLYKCIGTCQSYMNKFTNHSKLLKILQRDNETKICCVPRKYSSATFIFFDRCDNIAIKKYYNMIVNGCSCR